MIDFFYSDAHFGHDIILELAHRPFSSIEEHDVALIEYYNEIVRPRDNVLWLGDGFLCNAERAQRIVNSMNGRKLSMLGNHDRSARWLARLGFTVIDGELLLQIGRHSARVSHFPYAGTPHAKGEDERCLELRPKRRQGEVLIHGHVHSKDIYRDNAVHVGVDAWDYRPVSVKEVELLLDTVRR